MVKRLLVIAIFCLPMSLLAAGKIFTWTDEDGNVFYGDRPPSETEVTEVTIVGKKKAPLIVDDKKIPGQWFGRSVAGGEVKITFDQSGTITFIQTKPDQSVFNYQGIWTYETNSITVITEFSQTAPPNGEFKRSVEPIQLTYNILRFAESEMELIIGDERFIISKII